MLHRGEKSWRDALKSECNPLWGQLTASDVDSQLGPSLLLFLLMHRSHYSPQPPSVYVSVDVDLVGLKDLGTMSFFKICTELIYFSELLYQSP